MSQRHSLPAGQLRHLTDKDIGKPAVSLQIGMSTGADFAGLLGNGRHKGQIHGALVPDISRACRAADSMFVLHMP